MKTCSKCKIEKELSEFYKDKWKIDDYCSSCQLYHIKPQKKSSWKLTLSYIKSRCNFLSTSAYQYYGRRGIMNMRIVGLFRNY